MNKPSIPKLFSPPSFSTRNIIDNFFFTFYDIAPDSASKFFDILEDSTLYNSSQTYLLDKLRALPLDDVPQPLKHYFLHQHLEQILLFHLFTSSSEFREKQKLLFPIFSSLSNSLKFSNFLPSYQAFKNIIPQNIFPLWAGLLLNSRINLDTNQIKLLVNNLSLYNTDDPLFHTLTASNTPPDLDKIFQYIGANFLSSSNFNHNPSQISPKSRPAFNLSNNFFICKKISTDFLSTSPFFHFQTLANCESANSAKLFSMLIEQGIQAQHQALFDIKYHLKNSASAFYLPENLIIRASKKSQNSIIYQAFAWAIIKSITNQSQDSLFKPVYLQKLPRAITHKTIENKEKFSTLIESTQNHNNYVQTPLFALFTYHSYKKQSSVACLHPNIIRQFLLSYSTNLSNNKLFIDSLTIFAQNKNEYLSQNNQPYKNGTSTLDWLFSTIDNIILDASLNNNPCLTQSPLKHRL